jgi:hypothetical protein
MFAFEVGSSRHEPLEHSQSVVRWQRQVAEKRFFRGNFISILVI